MSEGVTLRVNVWRLIKVHTKTVRKILELKLGLVIYNTPY